MAFPVSTPRTWVVGEVVSASQLNTEIRDQLAALSVQAGQITLSLSGTSSTTGNVTFSPAFSAAPRVVATVATGAGAATAIVVRVLDISTTGFTVAIADANGANQTVSVPVNWIAVRT